ncbi:hypothetical protein [Pseudonocardia sp. T1-2H]|uniref:hypothetical protein n=1 Tax=Pseudonocardia sp. T1-2H TaxID=3128899 RepID=UPI003100AC44
MTPGARFDVAVHRLVIGPDHPPGLHLPGVLSLVDGSRQDDRPLEVAPLGDDLWEIRNGRHRFMAAVVTGRSHLACTLAS